MSSATRRTIPTRLSSSDRIEPDGGGRTSQRQGAGARRLAPAVRDASVVCLMALVALTQRQGVGEGVGVRDARRLGRVPDGGSRTSQRQGGCAGLELRDARRRGGAGGGRWSHLTATARWRQRLTFAMRDATPQCRIGWVAPQQQARGLGVTVRDRRRRARGVGLRQWRSGLVRDRPSSAVWRQGGPARDVVRRTYLEGAVGGRWGQSASPTISGVVQVGIVAVGGLPQSVGRGFSGCGQPEGPAGGGVRVRSVVGRRRDRPGPCQSDPGRSDMVPSGPGRPGPRTLPSGQAPRCRSGRGCWVWGCRRGTGLSG